MSLENIFGAVQASDSKPFFGTIPALLSRGRAGGLLTGRYKCSVYVLIPRREHWTSARTSSRQTPLTRRLMR